MFGDSILLLGFEHDPSTKGLVTSPAGTGSLMPEVEDFGTQETARSDWTVCVWFRGLQGCGRKTYAYLLIFIFILGLSTTHQKAWGGTPRGSFKQLLQMSRANALLHQDFAQTD